MNTQGTPRQNLFFFFSDFTGLRGGEKFLFSLITRVPKKFRVVLVIERLSSYWHNQCKKSGVEVVVLSPPKILYWELLPFLLVKNFFMLKRLVRSGDRVVAANFPLSLLGVLLSKRTTVFCFEPFSMFYDTARFNNVSLSQQIVLSIIRFFYRPLDRYATTHAWKTSTINSVVGDAMKHEFGIKPDFYIPNGVDTTVFRPTVKPLFLKRGTRVLGHSTDYSPLKGTENFLRALPSVIQKHANVRVLISESVASPAGKIGYEKLVVELGLQRVVRFVHTVSEQNLPRFYASCDVFCYCGSTLCIGGSSASLSVIEAQSCGVPVLRTLGNNDEIVDGKTGLYFASEDPTDIAKTINRFLSFSRSRVVKMEKTSRQYCVSARSWDKSTYQLMKNI